MASGLSGWTRKAIVAIVGSYALSRRSLPTVHRPSSMHSVDESAVQWSCSGGLSRCKGVKEELDVSRRPENG